MLRSAKVRPAKLQPFRRRPGNIAQKKKKKKKKGLTQTLVKSAALKTQNAKKSIISASRHRRAKLSPFLESSSHGHFEFG